MKTPMKTLLTTLSILTSLLQTNSAFAYRAKPRTPKYARVQNKGTAPALQNRDIKADPTPHTYPVYMRLSATMPILAKGKPNQYKLKHSGPSWSFAVGKDYKDMFVELEYNRTKMKGKDKKDLLYGAFSSQILFANIGKEFIRSRNISIFAGAGMGITWNKAHDVYQDVSGGHDTSLLNRVMFAKTKIRPAAQLFLGWNYRFHTSLSMGIIASIKYLGLFRSERVDPNFCCHDAHKIYVGTAGLNVKWHL
jgi:hypothetical protein